MLNLYLYLILQLLIVVLIYYGLNLSIRYAPSKIKLLSIIVLSALMMRGISLLILFLWDNIVNLYLLKPFVFLNLAAIPLTAVICMYIFIRDDKINFSYSFLIAAVLLILYLLFVVKVPHGVQYSNKFGYHITLLKPEPVLYSYIALHTCFMVITIMQIGKAGANNLGLYFVLLAVLVSIAERLLGLMGSEFLANSIAGDVLWTGILCYALAGFKKRLKK
jgi:hypothetical protein